jgi:hypothetical protein
MSETVTVSDIVGLSATGDSAGVKSAIGDVLQQKIVVELENKKKDFAKTFLNKQNTDPKGPESQEEITDGSRDTSTN